MLRIEKTPYLGAILPLGAVVLAVQYTH